VNNTGTNKDSIMK